MRQAQEARDGEVQKNKTARESKSTPCMKHSELKVSKTVHKDIIKKINSQKRSEENSRNTNLSKSKFWV